MERELASLPRRQENRQITNKIDFLSAYVYDNEHIRIVW